MYTNNLFNTLLFMSKLRLTFKILYHKYIQHEDNFACDVYRYTPKARLYHHVYA